MALRLVAKDPSEALGTMPTPDSWSWSLVSSIGIAPSIGAPHENASTTAVRTALQRGGNEGLRHPGASVSEDVTTSATRALKWPSATTSAQKLVWGIKHTSVRLISNAW